MQAEGSTGWPQDLTFDPSDLNASPTLQTGSLHTSPLGPKVP